MAKPKLYKDLGKNQYWVRIGPDVWWFDHRSRGTSDPLGWTNPASFAEMKRAWDLKRVRW